MYEEEKILGNQFVLNCKVGIENKKVNHLNDTIDYAKLLHIIKEYFNNATPLLETLAQNIERDIKTEFESIKYFYISIQKKYPALSAVVESSEIIIEKKYD